MFYRINYAIFLAIQALDTGSYFVFQQDLNYATIASIQIRNLHLTAIYVRILLIPLALLVIYLVCVPTKIYIPYPKRVFYLLAGSIPLLLSLTRHYKSLYPEFAPVTTYNNSILEFFSAPRHATRDPTKKRNMIVINFESLQEEILGYYNSGCPESMPGLSRVIQETTYCSNVHEQPYLSFSMASILAVECGVPFLVPDMVSHSWGGEFGNFSSSKKFFCMGDILTMAGYALEVHFGTDSAWIHGKGPFFTSHGYTTFNNRIHQDDYKVFMVSRKRLLDLHRGDTPFLYYIETTNTHIDNVRMDTGCVDRLPSKCHFVLSGFDCVDQIVTKFLEWFNDSPLVNDTDILIFGDHHTYISPASMFRSSINKLPIFIPTRDKVNITKSVTHYDIGPTILDMLGVTYTPKFPFGQSFLREGESTPPGADEFAQIYSLVKEDLNFSWTPQCSDREGFCTNTSSYIDSLKYRRYH